jgi:hypothetical protein
MLTPEEEAYISSKAYIPEHLVGLMTSLCSGEPFLIEDHFCCQKDDWLILVGYPLQGDFILDEFNTTLENVKKQFRPRYLSLISAQLSASFASGCKEHESDFYYTLDPQKLTIDNGIRRNLKKAAKALRLERSKHMLAAHYELMQEFMANVLPPSRVEALLQKMPDFVKHADSAMVLNAWDSKKNLAAFYVVDLAANLFSNYVIGCYSKKNYARGASDLLLYELIQISLEKKKSYIHLGLGVNDGIRRFKEKWGGKPTLSYGMCELVLRKPSVWNAIKALNKF